MQEKAGCTGNLRHSFFFGIVSQDVFKNGSKGKSPHTLLQPVEHKAHRAFGAAAHKEGKEQLFLCEKESEQRLIGFP